MWAWLVTYILGPLFSYIWNKEEPIIEQKIEDFFQAQKDKATDDSNVQKQQQAAESGDHDKLADATTDLLNGTDGTP